LRLLASRYSATVREVYGPSNGQPDRRTARQRRYIPMGIVCCSPLWVSVIDASAGTCTPARARACRTATTRNCTRKRPRRRSALDTLTVLERLGSEQSTPGSCMPKCSASKPKRTSEQPLGRAGRATTGRTSLDAALWRRRGPEVSGQVQNWMDGAPGFGWRRVQPEPDHPPVRASQNPSLSWSVRLTVSNRGRRTLPGRGFGAADMPGHEPSAVILKVPHRSVDSMQVGQWILQVGQL
jgi:hypothetical protein